MFNMQIISKLEYTNYLPKQIIQQASKMVDQQKNKHRSEISTISADLIKHQSNRFEDHQTSRSDRAPNK